jgi:hypothetical protein
MRSIREDEAKDQSNIGKEGKGVRYKQNKEEHEITVALRVVRSDGKGTQCPGGSIGATLFLGDINTGTWPSRLAVSRIGTIKYGLESRGTALTRTSSNSKLQARPLVREGASK